MTGRPDETGRDRRNSTLAAVKGVVVMCFCFSPTILKVHSHSRVWMFPGLFIALTVCLMPLIFPARAHAAQNVPRSHLRLTDAAATTAGAGTDSLKYLLEHYTLFSFGDIVRSWYTKGAVAVQGNFSADGLQYFGADSRENIHSVIHGNLMKMKPADFRVPDVFLGQSNAIFSDDVQNPTYTVNSTRWNPGERLAVNTDYLDFGHASVRISHQSETLARKSVRVALDPSTPNTSLAGVTYRGGVLSVPAGSHLLLSLDDFNHVTNVNIVRRTASVSAVPATVISVSDSGEAHLPTVMVDGSPISPSSSVPALVWNLPVAGRVVSAGGFNPYGLPFSWQRDDSKPVPKWEWSAETHVYGYDESGAVVAPHAHFLRRAASGNIYGPLIVGSADLNSATEQPDSSRIFDFSGADEDDNTSDHNSGHGSDPSFVVNPGFISLVARKHVNSAEPSRDEHFWFASDYYDPHTSTWQTAYTRNTDEKDANKGGSSVRFDKLPVRAGKSWFSAREILPGEDEAHPQPQGYHYDSHLYWVSYEVSAQETRFAPRALRNFIALSAHASQFTSSSVPARVTRTVYSQDDRRTNLEKVKHQDGSIDTAHLRELSHDTGLVDADGRYIALEPGPRTRTRFFAAHALSHNGSEQITFNNTTIQPSIVTPIQISLPVSTQLIGGELRGSDFRFDLVGADALSTATIPASQKSVVNDTPASGSSVRGTIEQCRPTGTSECFISSASAQFHLTLNQPGTYHYRLFEEMLSTGSFPGRVNTDTAVFDVVYRVIQSGSRLEVAQSEIQKRKAPELTAEHVESILFTNILRSNPRTVLPHTGGDGSLIWLAIAGTSLLVGCLVACVAWGVSAHGERHYL
jgi:hypothetical protein